jgi:aspartate aminotransferase-like enzyme
MAAADIHHRTAEFKALYSKVLAQLKEFVGTRNDVLLMSASGTGAMEAAVSNLTSPGDRVLVLSAGKFGERWVSLAKAFGCEADVLSAPYGKTFDLEDVRQAIKPNTRAVYMQATETSTAIRHCVQGVAELLKSIGSDALLVVDGITGLGTTHLDVDGWGVDILVGGSQKAVMIPPGLCYLSVSERAFQRMAETKNPRYYFDLLKERKNALKGDSSYTPSVALIAGLGAALDYISAQGGGEVAAGRKKLVENAETCAAMTRAAVDAMGLKLFAPDAPSAAVTAVLPPEGVDSGVIVKELKARFAAVITNGQGEMQGKLFRIAHLGYFDYMDTISLVGALELVAVETLKLPGVTLGDALTAAQRVFSSRRANEAEYYECSCGRQGAHRELPAVAAAR